MKFRSKKSPASRLFAIVSGLLLINGFLFLGFSIKWAALAALLVATTGFYFKGGVFVLIAIWSLVAAFGNSIIVNEYTPRNVAAIATKKTTTHKQKVLQNKQIKAESKKNRMLELLVWLFPLSNSAAFVLIFLAGRQYELF